MDVDASVGKSVSVDASVGQSFIYSHPHPHPQDSIKVFLILLEHSNLSCKPIETEC
jgi:hypothetical protein